MEDSDILAELRALRKELNASHARIEDRLESHDEKTDIIDKRLVAIETKFKIILPVLTLFITSAYDFVKRKFLH